MTAHALSGDREKCVEAGMDGYLSKPIDPELLFEAVEQRGAGETIAPDPTRSAAATFDERALLKRLEGDTSLMHDVIQIFLTECPLQLAAIRTAVAQRNPAAIRAAAHTLVGAAANMSAVRLSETARVLERLGEESRIDAAEAAWRSVSIEAARLIETLQPLMAAVTEPHSCTF